MIKALISWARGMMRRPQQASAISRIEQAESELLKLPQLEMPVTHRFAPGVYAREIFMPAGDAGSLVLGHEHKTEHFNIVLTGRALVSMDGKTEEIVAPCIFKSGKGVRKALLIIEDMRWITIHPTKETDVTKLEDDLVIKSDSFVERQKQLQEMKALSAFAKGELVT